jgi:hypothetical protein
VSVPAWAWAAFAAFVIATLALDLFVLHRRAREVSLRALYFLLAGAAARSRYLQPGLAVILAAVAVKLLTADLYEVPAWASPAFIAAVLAVVAIMSIRERRPAARPAGPCDRSLRPGLRRGAG